METHAERHRCLINAMNDDTFIHTGLFSKRAEEGIAWFNVVFAKLRSLYEELNRFACCLRIKIKRPKGDMLRGAFATCVWNRLLDSYQCVLLLQERGGGDEAKGCLRSVLESLFLLEANRNKKTFARRYILHDTVMSLKTNMRLLKASQAAKRLNKVQFLPDEGRKGLRAVINQMRNELGNRKAKKAKKPNAAKQKTRRHSNYSPSENAKEAGSGMVYEYNKSYGLLCMHTHTSVSGNLAKYLKPDLDPSVANFVVGPAYDDAHITLLLAMEYLIMALSSMNKLFALGEETAIEEYEKKWAELDTLAKEMPPLGGTYDRVG
jgi:hypothetical protein